nr:MAG TPA: hypothetical protein [Caudoviricetes sp.]
MPIRRTYRFCHRLTIQLSQPLKRLLSLSFLS